VQKLLTDDLPALLGDNQNSQSPSSLESLVAKCSQPPIFEYEGYVVRPFDSEKLWFENPAGEGTTLGRGRLFTVLADLFKEVFW
jgi:hypothetical protein